VIRYGRASARMPGAPRLWRHVTIRPSVHLAVSCFPTSKVSLAQLSIGYVVVRP
jgi:hypothetical protein